MNPLDINVFNVLIFGAVFIGTTFGALLIFTKRINQRANLFLGLLAFLMVLWNIWVLSVDFDYFAYYPYLSLLPLNFSLTLGPLLFFYTKSIADSTFQFKSKQAWHFAPLALELTVHFMIAVEALESNVTPVNTSSFGIYIPIIQLLAISSIVIYAFKALEEIRNYHQWVRANFSVEEEYNLRWLFRLIVVFGLFWLILVPYTAVDYFFYDFQLSIGDYYPIYMLMSAITIWISAEAFLKPEIVFAEKRESLDKKSSNASGENLDSDVEWLENEMERNQYFLDSALNLRQLASELAIHPNRLSKVINEGASKNFNDFVNEYRVNSVINRLHDPKYEHITLLGISFECGFNSKTTFNRVFKNFTGKTPLQYKKEGPKV